MDSEPTPAPVVGLADVSDAPHWLPAPAELDDVELALAGVALPVLVRVSAKVAAALSDAVGLVVTDPEGTPLALLHPDAATTLDEAPDAAVVVATSLVALQPAEHGPFRRLRRSAAEIRAASAPAPTTAAGEPSATGSTVVTPADAAAATVPLAVLVDQPLQEAHLAAIANTAAGRQVLFLVLAGHGSPLLVDAATLIRTTVLAAESLTGARVVVVPLARRSDPVVEAARRDAVVAAYREDDGQVGVLALDRVADALPVEAVRAVLDANQELTAGTYAAPIEALVLRSHRRPDEQGLTVLFTGLSGSGKSTVARAFAETVAERFGRTITLLDGDVVRNMLSAGLTFSKADRETNIRRIGFVAAEINRHGGLAVCCPIAPYASTRADVRTMVEAVGAFVLVHISTPLAECERRDRKGLYAKARAGLIPEFTGISDPYEEPTDADLAIDTTHVSVAAAVEQVVEHLVARGFLVPA